MYLKSVEIVGFKSFADKTKLDFKPGMSAVIGPNGSGKSNVNEAIRWCIGEMSWKSLRSTAMVDVIFAGTARRQPLNMAEVTLTFDNTKGMLPLPYSEITVSRKLFRSGESEYYLNKTQCRLRDVRELFLDTGLGNDGYAIIDQGGVDFVIKAKPEDRRALFEEAAGVSKYKAKREEALRKLERVEADLARLSDSMALINEQIRKLDNDAKKAKQFQKYKEELTGLEVAGILADVGGTQAELDREAALVAPVREGFDARTHELHAEEGRLAALALERTGLQAQAAEANQALAEVKAELSRLAERLANNAAAREDLGRRDASAQAEIDFDKNRLASLEPELARAQAAAEASLAKEKDAQGAVEAFEGESEGLEQAAADAHQAFEDLKNRALQASRRAVDATNGLGQSESLLGRLQFDLEQALKDLEKQSRRTDSTRGELDEQLAKLLEARLWLGDTQSVVGAIDEAGSGFALRRAAVDEEVSQTRTEAAVLRAKVETLAAQGSSDPYWAGAHAVVAAGIPGVLGTVRSIIGVDEPYARMVEGVLGERLYAVVCEDSAASQAAFEFLAGTGKRRARILVLSSVGESSPSPVSCPPESKLLMDQVRCEPRYQPALRLLLGEAYSLGQTVYGSHWVFGGAPPSTEGLNLKLADVQAFQRAILELERREQELVAKRRDLDEKAQAHAAKLELVRGAQHEEQARVRVLEAVLRERQELVALSQRDADLFHRDAARKLAEMAELREALHELRRSLETLKQDEAALREKETHAAEAIEALKAAAAERRIRRNELGSMVAVAAAERSASQRDYDARAMEKETLESSMNRRSTEREEISRRFEDCAAVENGAREATETLQGRRGEVEARVSEFAARLTEMDAAASALEATIRELKAACEEDQQKLHLWEVHASGLKAKQDGLKSRLWDEWQLPYEEAQTKYAGINADADRVQFLRKRIQSLGNINMAAPEEYEALTGKHGFLKTQVDDLTKAKDDLREAINKINATTRENFRNTFTSVREHFRRIYGSLFDGGEADLVLTQPENILETGIDIVAQPPGKRLQSISLLSGGEKTLTAIALLFAFFMVRPSPVCMLDEADAALDEANTERFAAMLKEFSDKTQFIVVSHSKRTIEAAEQIYGVTMEEGGVSQIISVNFRRRGEGEVETKEDLEAKRQAEELIALATAPASETPAPAPETPPETSNS